MRGKTLLAAAALTALIVPAQQAQAVPRLSISSSAGGASASADGPTTLSISGSGFQSLPNAFGGVYLMFGWVSDPGGGSWKPSRGGHAGSEMLYVPDSEAKDNQGYQRFIAFPGSSTADSANGGQLATDGSFSLRLVVPGPTFTAQDRDGNTRDVDCREVQCGIITIGAHGVVNANNESFTPISFGSGDSTSGGSTSRGSTSSGSSWQGGSSGAAGSSSAGSDADDAEPPGASASPSASGSPAPEVPATLGLSLSTIQAGRVLGYTGQGFDPGEQVVATVGAGLAGVGPLTAGRFGEVAGAITLPVDMRAGTHTVTLSAAGSGKVAEANLSVLADPTSVAVDSAQVEEPAPGWRWATVAVAVAGGLLLIVIVSSLVTAIMRRRAASRAGKVRRPVQPKAKGGPQ